MGKGSRRAEALLNRSDWGRLTQAGERISPTH